VYFEIVITSRGFRAQIKANNDEVVFVSEAYATKSVAENAIEMIQTGIDTAPVRDDT
jgi:uncharacterized protein YegP (UPF0339 family)